MRHIWASAPPRCLLNLVVSALDLKFSAIAVMESACCCLWRPLVLAPQCWYNAVYSREYVYVLWTRAGRDLPVLAKISFAAGLLASGGWNKNDSRPRGREWTQLLLSASLGDHSYPSRPAPSLWMRSFPPVGPSRNPLLPLDALV